MVRRPAATRQKWVRFPPAFLGFVGQAGRLPHGHCSLRPRSVTARHTTLRRLKTRFNSWRGYYNKRLRSPTAGLRDDPMPSTDWWQTFFSGLILDMWRAAMTPEQTRTEADFLQRVLEVPD